MSMRDICSKHSCDQWSGINSPQCRSTDACVKDAKEFYHEADNELIARVAAELVRDGHYTQTRLEES